MEYTLDYFIAKFTNTRDNLWCTNHYQYDGKSCAMGWCGVDSNGYLNSSSHEANELIVLFDLHGLSVEDVNDAGNYKYQQATPKERILAALYDIKKSHQLKYYDITRELASKPILQEVPDIKIKEVITH